MSPYRKNLKSSCPKGFKIIPFGNAKAFEDAITPNTIAIMIEPIQGEAGVILPPEGYLKEVKTICEKQDIVFILDEIQTGLGRTGKLLAEEHEGIEADVTVIGKALSGGLYPVSAVLSTLNGRRVISSCFRVGFMGLKFLQSLFPALATPSEKDQRVYP